MGVTIMVDIRMYINMECIHMWGVGLKVGLDHVT